jgi:hypothetical protein
MSSEAGMNGFVDGVSHLQDTSNEEQAHANSHDSDSVQVDGNQRKEMSRPTLSFSETAPPSSPRQHEKLHTEQTSRSFARAAHFRTPPDTPAARTGPPRSLSYAYSIPISSSASKNYSQHENRDSTYESSYDNAEHSFSLASSDFRGALEYNNASKEPNDKRGKKRESRLIDESWNPMRWFHESPKEEKTQMDFPAPDSAQMLPDGNEEKREPRRGASTQEGNASPASLHKTFLRRAFSVPRGTSNKINHLRKTK